MEKRRVIGLDFDDVLMDFRFSLDNYHNELFGTNFTREEARSYSLPSSWGVTEEEAANRVVSFYHSDHHHAADPVDNAQDALKALSRNCDFVIITSRPEFIKERTLEWLNKHYPDTFKHVCFTNLYLGKDNHRKRSKAEACAEFGVEVFVDDHIENAENVAASGVPVLLLDKPWNREVENLHPNITRAYSWDHVLELLS